MAINRRPPPPTRRRSCLFAVHDPPTSLMPMGDGSRDALIRHAVSLDLFPSAMRPRARGSIRGRGNRGRLRAVIRDTSTGVRSSPCPSLTRDAAHSPAIADHVGRPPGVARRESRVAGTTAAGELVAQEASDLRTVAVQTQTFHHRAPVDMARGGPGVADWSEWSTGHGGRKGVASRCETAYDEGVRSVASGAQLRRAGGGASGAALHNAPSESTRFAECGPVSAPDAGASRRARLRREREVDEQWSCRTVPERHRPSGQAVVRRRPSPPCHGERRGGGVVEGHA